MTGGISWIVKKTRETFTTVGKASPHSETTRKVGGAWQKFISFLPITPPYSALYFICTLPVLAFLTYKTLFPKRPPDTFPSINIPSQNNPPPGEGQNPLILDNRALIEANSNINNLQSQIVTLTTSLNNRERELTQANFKISELTTTLNSSWEELRMVDSAMRDLENQIVTLKEDLDRHKQELVKTRSTIEGLEKDNARSKLLNDALEKLNTELQDQICTLENSTDQQKYSKTVSLGDNNQEVIEQQDLMSRVHNLEVYKFSSETAKKQLTTDLTKAKSEIHELKVENKKLRETIEKNGLPIDLSRD